MSGTGRTLPALAVTGVVLVFIAWFDSMVMTGAYRSAAATFDPAVAASTRVLGSFVVAGSVLLVATLAWWAGSTVVSVAYLVVGGFFAILPWILWTFAAQVNDTPPILPEPLVQAVSDLYHSTDGPLNAVGTVGAGMAFAAVATTARSWRERA
jgi:hypothetical protein